MVLSSRPVEEAFVASENYLCYRVKWYFSGRTYYSLPNAAYDSCTMLEYRESIIVEFSLPPDTTTYFMVAVLGFCKIALPVF